MCVCVCVCVCVKDALDASAADEDWYGHKYSLEIIMMALRLLTLNDANKKKFVAGGMIPFILEFLSFPNKVPNPKP